MEVGLWHGIGPTENSGANFQSTNVNYAFAKTNTVFAKTSTPQIPNVATIAVGNTPSDAHAHQKEMESMRRDGSGHPDDLARVLARVNYKEGLSQKGLSQHSSNVAGWTSNPPWSGSSTEKSGMTPPTENHVIDQTNVLTASCSFDDVSYHHFEMESVRRDARVALEANRQLQE